MWNYLSLLPVILALWAIAGIWIVFAIAVVNGSVDLEKGFPFISNCGSYAPQSCIFGQILNTGAALGKYFQTFPFITSPKLPKGFLSPPPPDQSNRLP